MNQFHKSRFFYSLKQERKLKLLESLLLHKNNYCSVLQIFPNKLFYQLKVVSD